MPKIYFVTNRNQDSNQPGGFGGQFSQADIHDLRFGRANVVKRKNKFVLDYADLQDEVLSLDPNRQKLGSAVIFAELRADMAKGADTIALIHGYNVSFEEALVKAGRVRAAYRTQARKLNVIVFSWPSDGSMAPLRAYKSDRADARATGPAAGRMLFRLRDFLAEVRRGEECGGRIHLMAHSMGNYVLRNGLQELRRELGERLPLLFDQIFLFAADEDHDAFEHLHKMMVLPQIALGVNVYFNSGDTALVISDRTKSNPARLGARGPRLPLSVPGNVTLLDCSDVVSGAVEHSYFLDNAKTRRDVGAVLDGVSADRVVRRRYVASQNRYVLM